jgi:hypothetical protein
MRQTKGTARLVVRAGIAYKTDPLILETVKANPYVLRSPNSVVPTITSSDTESSRRAPLGSVDPAGMRHETSPQCSRTRGSSGACRIG